MIFYDFEVFREDWMVCFIDAIREEIVFIENDRSKLKRYFDNRKNDIYIGYNNLRYDQYIYKAILLGLNPYEVSQWIIEKKQPGWKFSNEFNGVKIISYDLYQEGRSLKQLEGYMGENIEESTVPFTINRKLNEEEMERCRAYCKYDVEQTMRVFMHNQDDFYTKLDIINAFNLPLEHISKSNAQLSSIVLEAKKTVRLDEFVLDLPDTLNLSKYKYIMDWYLNHNEHDYTSSLNVEILGVEHVFAWGGLHGARRNYIDSGNFVLLDIDSFYPSLMIEYGFLSRNVANKEKFEQIYRERINRKKAGDNQEKSLKMILNTTYGAMGYKYNDLLDLRMKNNICVSGQLLLLDLLEKIEKIDGVALIQTNTDGVILKYRDSETLSQIRMVLNEWSRRTSLNADFQFFTKIIQKDVNNYIALGNENIFVGSYVKDLSGIDYDLPVINKAIREYFINGTLPEVYIGNEDRLIEFQRIVKISSLYDNISHGGKILDDKTARCFASSNIFDDGLYRTRVNDGTFEKAKFPDTSSRCFIDNGDVKNKKTPSNLDKRWYIDLAWKRIKSFLK